MSSILQFPHDLRDKVNKGAHHISFEIIGTELKEDANRIHLYVPQGFSMQDGAQFGTVDLGVISALKAESETGTEEQKKKESLAIAALVASNAGGAAENVVKANNLESGVASNNFTTATFDGMNIRNYTFTFNLVASSAEESDTLRKIEHTFRKYMYPKKVLAFALEYPPLFRVRFMQGKKQNKFMPLLFDSYLTGLTTQFNNNGNMYHKDGSPTDLSIQLEFQEQRQLMRDDLYEAEDVPIQDIVQRTEFPPSKDIFSSKGDG